MGFGQINELQQGIDTQTTRTESAKQVLNTFDDFQKINSPENQQLLQQIITSSDGNDEAIQNGLKDIYKTNPDQKDIQQLLQAIITSGPDFIDQGEIADHWKNIQETNQNTEKQIENHLEAQNTIKKKDEIIKVEKTETKKGQEDLENMEKEKEEKDIENKNKKEQLEEQAKIAKQNADKIQSENSEKFQQAQEKTTSTLQIDESKLQDSPLQKDDIAKLITLQRNPDLKNEDIFADDANRQEVLTYLSDGSFDNLKLSLGIQESRNTMAMPTIDSLDDIAHPSATKQIPGFEQAHQEQFDNTLNKLEHLPKYHKLASSLLEDLPTVHYTDDEGHTKIRLNDGREALASLGMELNGAEEKLFLKGLGLHQKLTAENRAPNPRQQSDIDYTIDTISHKLQKQTTESIKQSTQQNYLSHTAHLFGSMADDIQTSPSDMSYDAERGLSISFGINGHKFHNPLTIGDHVTGPNIIDRTSGVAANGAERVTNIGNTNLTTMPELIQKIDPSIIFKASNYKDYQQQLNNFKKQQLTELRHNESSQRVSIQRYATKLETHLEGRQIATELNTFDSASNINNGYNEHGNIDNQEYQALYKQLDRTTSHNSTAENAQFAHDMKTLSRLPRHIRSIGLSENNFNPQKIQDPILKTLLDRSEDIPNRAESFFSFFQGRGEKSPLNTKDIHTFTEYATHVIQKKTPQITFSDYLKKKGQTISFKTQSTYREAMENKESQTAEANLETQLKNIETPNTYTA